MTTTDVPPLQVTPQCRRDEGFTPVRRFTSRKGQRHLSGLWFSSHIFSVTGLCSTKSGRAVRAPARPVRPSRRQTSAAKEDARFMIEVAAYRG